MEALTYLPNLADSWFSETFVPDTETLTTALQTSFSGNTNSTTTTTATTTSTIFQTPETAAQTTSSDLAPAKRLRNAIPVASRKVSKKSRASKQSKTMFIAADAANFRQMVQEVTGCGFNNSQMPVLKPEPLRPSGSRLQAFEGGVGLPTLDTSTFLLDHHQQQVVRGSGFPQAMVADGGSGLDFDTSFNFPTLDSGEVM